MAHEFILAIAGQMGSGKSKLAVELCHTLPADSLSFGNYVRNQASMRKMETDIPSLQALGESLIAEMGVSEFVKAVLRSAEGNNEAVVIDGIRSIDVWHQLQGIAVKSALIYVDTSDDVRRERLQQTGKVNITSLDAAMRHPLELSALELRQQADITISGKNPPSANAQLIASQLDWHFK